MHILLYTAHLRAVTSTFRKFRGSAEPLVSLLPASGAISDDSPLESNEKKRTGMHVAVDKVDDTARNNERTRLANAETRSISRDLSESMERY